MTDPNAICPGQKAMLPGESPFYLRAVFIFYWWDDPPSAEKFYLHNRPLVLTGRGEKEFEAEVMKLVEANVGKTPKDACYFGYSGIELTDEEVADYGWRVIRDRPQPIPSPDPAPAPVPAHVQDFGQPQTEPDE